GFVLADPNVSISGPDGNGVFTVRGSHTYADDAVVSGVIQVRINHESSGPSPVVTLPVSVAAVADLRLGMVISNPTPTVGETVTSTITLTNAGPSPATNVTVQDLLPAGLTFLSASTSQGGLDSATGVWTVGTVTVATPLTLTISVKVTAPDAQTLTALISH